MWINCFSFYICENAGAIKYLLDVFISINWHWHVVHFRNIGIIWMKMKNQDKKLASYATKNSYWKEALKSTYTGSSISISNKVFFFEFLYCIICNAVGPEEVSVENDPKSSDWFWITSCKKLFEKFMNLQPSYTLSLLSRSMTTRTEQI